MTQGPKKVDRIRIIKSTDSIFSSLPVARVSFCKTKEKLAPVIEHPSSSPSLLYSFFFPLSRQNDSTYIVIVIVIVIFHCRTLCHCMDEICFTSSNSYSATATATASSSSSSSSSSCFCSSLYTRHSTKWLISTASSS